MINSTTRSLDVIVGGQYGSEAKGHVTARVVDTLRNADGPIINIRVAGPNAGHTVYDDDGNKFAFRHLPVGMVRNDRAFGVIAAGSEIDFDVLLDEIRTVEAIHGEHSITNRLFVDSQATMLTEDHRTTEQVGNLVDRLGSTGKGIGAARSARIMRYARIAKEDNRFGSHGIKVLDTASTVRVFSRARLVVEGTQGYGLGLHAGHYPFCTSSDCRAIDFLAMAGISPWALAAYPHMFRVWVVARMFPIRVAGNSGSMKMETSWEALGLPEERTTVTNKVRRVGHWDDNLIQAAVIANGGGTANGGPVRLAITMIDQKWPAMVGATSMQHVPEQTRQEIADFLHGVAENTGAPVEMITTSPTTGINTQDVLKEALA